MTPGHVSTLHYCAPARVSTGTVVKITPESFKVTRGENLPSYCNLTVKHEHVSENRSSTDLMSHPEGVTL